MPNAERKLVTATSTELIASSRGVLAALRKSIPRDEFFAGLYILGCANGLGVGIIQAANSGDWTGGLRNVSVIVWFACIAGVSLLLRDKNDEIRLADVPVALVFLTLVAVPVIAMNWAAMSGLSLYILLFANGSSSRRRGALILLALTVPMLWSRVLFAFFAKFFLPSL